MWALLTLGMIANINFVICFLYVRDDVFVLIWHRPMYALYDIIVISSSQVVSRIRSYSEEVFKMEIGLKLFLIVLTIGVTIASCPNYWTTYKSKCYKYFSDDHCNQQQFNYGRLASITSLGETDFITELTGSMDWFKFKWSHYWKWLWLEWWDEFFQYIL